MNESLVTFRIVLHTIIFIMYIWRFIFIARSRYINGAVVLIFGNYICIRFVNELGYDNTLFMNLNVLYLVLFVLALIENTYRETRIHHKQKILHDVICKEENI